MIEKIKTEAGTYEYIQKVLEDYFSSGQVIKLSVSILPTEPRELISSLAGRGFVELKLKLVKEV